MEVLGSLNISVNIAVHKKAGPRATNAPIAQGFRYLAPARYVSAKN